jgi:hypothetical protein
MRTNLTVALVTALLAGGMVWGCGDDDEPVGGVGGSGGSAGSAGSAGSSGNAGSAGDDSGSGGTDGTDNGGSGGTDNGGSGGTDNGGTGGTADVPDSGVDEDASVEDAGGGDEPDSSVAFDAGGLATDIEALCTTYCDQQEAFNQTVSGCDQDDGDCLGVCNSVTEFQTPDCQVAIETFLQCATTQGNYVCVDPDPGDGGTATEPAVDPSDCVQETSAAEQACPGVDF